MVIVFAAQAAVTPAGKLTGAPIPVAPVVVCVMAVSAVLIHNVGEEDAALTVLVGLTVIVPVAFTAPHLFFNDTATSKISTLSLHAALPILFAAQAAVTPAGKLTGAPIP